MGASTLIGSTYLMASATPVALTMDNVGFTVFKPTTIDDANNVGIGSNSDGTIENTSGAEQVIDGICFACVETPASYAVQIAPMVSTDGVTFTEVLNTSVAVKSTLTERGLYLSYTLTLPAGHFVGIGFKNFDANVSGNCFSLYHFARSRDGGDSPTLKGLTDNIAGNTAYTQAITTQNVYRAATGLTTIVQGVSSGLLDNNDGTFTNVSGETLIVDGLMFASISAITAQGLYGLSAGKDTGLGVTVLSNVGCGCARPTTTPYVAVYCGYTVSLDDGDTIAPMVTCHTSSNNVSIAGFQHFIRSRT